ARTRPRIRFDFSLRTSLAGPLQTTACARRPRASAAACAQIHQSRGVALDVLLGPLRPGELPQAVTDPPLSGVTAHREMAREHPLHVAVEDRFALAEGEHRDS